MKLSSPLLRRILLSLVLANCCAQQYVLGQEIAASNSAQTLSIASLEVAPDIDGTIGQPEWSGATIADRFFVQIEPEYGVSSSLRDVLYSFHPDLFVKLFVQTNSAISKENIQALWVWRFTPPFGSLQLAYQRGTSDQGQQSQQGDTFFAKLAWVF